MGHAFERQRCEISQRLARSPIIQSAGASRPSESGNHLEVNQLRSRKLLPAKARTHEFAITLIVRKGGREHRGIDNDHAARWRSSRTVSAAKASPSEPPARSPALSRTSSTVSSWAWRVS